MTSRTSLPSPTRRPNGRPEAPEPLSSPPRQGLDLSPAIRLWQAVGDTNAVLGDALDQPGGCAVPGPDVVGVLLPLAVAREGRLRMNELAQRSNLTPSGLTRRVDRLAADGLVQRSDCPLDRRGAYVGITPRGLVELEQALPHYQARLDQVVGRRLASDRVPGLVELLESLARRPSEEV